MPRLNRELLYRLLVVALIVNLLLLAWYLGVAYRGVLHSDSAVKNLLAQEIIDTGSYFPAQWTYANGDRWVFFTHTLVLPFLLVLPNGFAAHAAAGFVVAAFVLHATWLLCKELGMSPAARLVALVVLSAGLSRDMAENLYGQAAYGMLYCMGVWLLVACLRACAAQGRARAGGIAVAALVLLLVFWANPQRAVAYYLAPLLAAAFVVLARRRRLPARRDLALAAWLFLAAAVGTVLYKYSGGQLNGGAPPVFYTTPKVMLESIRRLFDGLFILLAGYPVEGSKVMHARGIVAAMNLVAAPLFLFVLLPWTVRRAWRRNAEGIDGAVAFALAGLAVSTFFVLATTLTVYSSSDGAIRYLVPHFVILLALFAGLAVDGAEPVTPLTVAAWAVLALFGARSFVAYAPIKPGYYEHVHQLQADRMIAFFKQHGLEYGYAPFWDAGRLTVRSGHQVRLRQIKIENGLPVPMRHLASDRWYEAGTWKGRTFLLLNTEEQQTFKADLMARRAGPPVATLDFERWMIIVYDHNIAADLPEWDGSTSKPRRFLADEAMPHLVGKVRHDPAAIVAEPGEAGALAFGQNIAAVPGQYVATFDVETDGAAGSFGTIDATSHGGSKRYGRQDIAGTGRRSVTLPINIDKTAGDLELRLFTNGAGRVVLHAITLQRVR
ncbi:hypothetical protein [Massilia sp. YMA4]|uniref:hypothetical protein n=1 Tax=Massilia sp. YMA4 TaxID=1593482 RepID=UPI000DD17666|nr:hypothetical protein [Massilia sp. YMA4]AXA94083.1 hypothetical protein DPH57_24875 [Massilia sp. YMA4]